MYDFTLQIEEDQYLAWADAQLNLVPEAQVIHPEAENYGADALVAYQILGEDSPRWVKETALHFLVSVSA